MAPELISVIPLIIFQKGWEALVADGNVWNPSGGSRDLLLRLLLLVLP